jgi:ketosteroid isomerase-like protein
MSAKQAASTEQDAELARATAAAFGRALTDGEVDGFLALLSRDVYYEAPSVMEHTRLKLNGRDEVREYIERTASEYQELGVETKKVSDLGGGRFLMVGWWHAKPRQSATPFGTPVGAVLDIRDGSVVKLRAFFDEQLAADAAERD